MDTETPAQEVARSSNARPKIYLVAGLAALVVVTIAAFVLLRSDTDEPATTEAASYETTEDLAAALEDGEVAADMSNPVRSPEGNVEFAYGTIDGGETGIFAIVFQDPHRIEIAVTHDFMAFRDEEPEAPERFLIGPNWFVKTGSLEAAQEIQRALGGEIKTYTR